LLLEIAEMEFNIQKLARRLGNRSLERLCTGGDFLNGTTASEAVLEGL
jgi:hypothetical protein